MAYPDPASVEAAFYAAFRELDEAGMLKVWSDSAEASCIHPGGPLLRGTQQIMQSWHEIFRDTSPPQVESRLIQASADQRLAVHTVEEHVSSANGARKAIILATNIYTYSQDGWRLLAHHASLPLVESSDEEAPPKALH
jgi:hypothetical protein